MSDTLQKARVRERDGHVSQPRCPITKFKSAPVHGAEHPSPSSRTLPNVERLP
jgi:hypothetical protein